MNVKHKQSDIHTRDLIRLIEKLTAEIVLLRANLKPPINQKYYSYKQASEMLCISVEGLRTRIRRGQMNRVSNNNRPLIEHKEIMRFLKEQNPTLEVK